MVDTQLPTASTPPVMVPSRLGAAVQCGADLQQHVLLPRVIRTLHLGKTSRRFWGGKLTKVVLGTFAQEPSASFLPFWCNPARGSHRHCPIAVFHRQKLALLDFQRLFATPLNR